MRLAAVECGNLANLVELRDMVESGQPVAWSFAHEVVANLPMTSQLATAWLNSTDFVFRGLALDKPTPGPTSEPTLVSEHSAANQPTPAVADADPAMEPTSPANTTQMQPLGPTSPAPSVQHLKLHVKAPPAPALRAEAPPATGPIPPTAGLGDSPVVVSSLQTSPPSVGRKVMWADLANDSANPGRRVRAPRRPGGQRP